MHSMMICMENNGWLEKIFWCVFLSNRDESYGCFFYAFSIYLSWNRGSCVEKLLWVQIPLCRLKNFEQNVDFPYIIYVTRSKTWRSMKPLKIFTWNCWKAHHGKKDDQWWWSWLGGLVQNKEVWFTSRKAARISQRFFPRGLSRKVEMVMRRV